jgi:hypothetical protein
MNGDQPGAGTGILDSLRRGWLDRGWSTESLAAMRMEDNGGSGNGGAGDGGTGGAGNSGSGSGDAGTGGTGDTGGSGGTGNDNGGQGGDGGAGGTGDSQTTFDAAYVRQLREESAGYRTKLREAEQERDAAKNKVTEFETAQLSEQERLTRQAEQATQAQQVAEATAREAERKAAETQLRYEIATTAMQSGVVDLEVATDLVFNRLERNEDGSLKAPISDVLGTVLETKPYLKGSSSSGPPNTGTTNGATGSNNRKALTLDDVRNMSDEEINARWEEVQPLLRKT